MRTVLGVGTATLIADYGVGQTGRIESPLQLLQRAIESGVLYIDTAPVYQDAEVVLGDLQPSPPPPVVGGVGTGMPAYRAGVKEGDRVLAVDGKPVHSFTEIALALRGRADQPVPIRIERDGKPFDLTIAPMRVDGTGEGALIGIEPPRLIGDSLCC